MTRSLQDADVTRGMYEAASRAVKEEFGMRGAAGIDVVESVHHIATQTVGRVLIGDGFCESFLFP